MLLGQNRRCRARGQNARMCAAERTCQDGFCIHRQLPRLVEGPRGGSARHNLSGAIRQDVHFPVRFRSLPACTSSMSAHAASCRCKCGHTHLQAAALPGCSSMPGGGPSAGLVSPEAILGSRAKHGGACSHHPAAGNPTASKRAQGQLSPTPALPASMRGHSSLVGGMPSSTAGTAPLSRAGFSQLRGVCLLPPPPLAPLPAPPLALGCRLLPLPLRGAVGCQRLLRLARPVLAWLAGGFRAIPAACPDQRDRSGPSDMGTGAQNTQLYSVPPLQCAQIWASIGDCGGVQMGR